MGLLDSVVGALGQAQGGGNGGGQAALLSAVVGMLSQGGGGAAGGLGGLGGLVEKFTQGGMGDIVNSWVSTGQNMPVSPDQLGQVLGNDTLAGLASQLGMGQGELGRQLSQLLPQVVDKLTPNGRLPDLGQGAGGLDSMGSMGDLAGMLGGLLRR